MPSSLAVIHSSTSGYSPRPPVSVYGTGPMPLHASRLFLPVHFPALSARPWTRGTVGFQVSPYGLQPTIPSVGGSSIPGSALGPACGYRNLNRFYISSPSRVPISPRLTLIRLTLFRKPWACGARVAPARCRYSCLHFLFRTLQNPSRDAFAAVRNAPLPLILPNQPQSSAPCFMPVHHPRGSARPVSCYALFE